MVDKDRQHAKEIEEKDREHAKEMEEPKLQHAKDQKSLFKKSFDLERKWRHRCQFSRLFKFNFRQSFLI